MDIRNMLKAVDDWKREHAPWARSEEGWDVFIWLLSARSQARPLKSLYYGSPFSENTLRAYIDSARHKLGAMNVTHAVALALARGIIVPAGALPKY